ncbi:MULTISPECIES: TfoX/Sxy family protein [unclassified Methanoculleus]|uniref:TfoX/Sxy family protein n=1 Tax=unclassified Methanoculleus TaxID=2619537 RepID=UPI0026008046|nr:MULTISPECIES: TfoX/Sxy family protein [unclassified Methanoculleus]MCK9318317.1 TfoX/Sxy family protein [Methanoculleus sp.]MDD2253855.1 TfoX/Sxy family protein [Methanoculleus sp.]MDD2786539.1 TfoX/Sxy family protein [Methanoculleus sp.]MDD3215612.1 TfoX/Sxy family protein [Methanoculleus sp.]MDD4313468.1 TfoX/Sxy family protein [Methanoculleus sp.]
MASTPEFVEFVAEQLGDAGVITYRKMFGEYGVYCNGKFFACVCNNQFFVKITEAGKEFMPDGETAPPYEGARPYFLIDELDDREFLKELVQRTCAALPARKPGKKMDR